MRTKTKPKPVYAIRPLDTVFAFDVSSTATGWAWGCFKKNAFQVMGFNVIRPKSGWDAVKRIDYMVAKIGSYVAMYAPALIVMEYQSHKSTGKHVQGLSTLGQAQGHVRQYLLPTYRVETVSEREWTKINGRNARKETRAEHVRALVPDYAEWANGDPKRDPGLDAADAIGLLLWRASQDTFQAENCFAK